MSSKRARALTNGIDSGGSGSGSGSGRSRNKRPRASEPGSSDESSADNRSNPASDSEASDQEDEEERAQQEVWATQQVQKERTATANKQNVATDAGIIEEIQCINFMCHEHLTVTLGPLINFIIGHNGSGKSAVLTALTICLGGKATATNRAQNLKSLIKEGKDHASVTVKIKNQGELAYKPAQYGESIIVERHFNRSGTSGFKLKDVNNRLVTNKKAELEDILDAFSMQIDNPMNVLTQDMARQFLNHSTPKDKYKFFLQGTQLENLSRDYQQIEQSLEVMNSKADVKETDLGVLRHRMEELEKKARRAQQLESMRAREAVLAKQATWAHVQEKEVELQDAIDGLEKVDNAIQDREKAVEEASELYERADQAYEAAKQTVTDITTELEPVSQVAMEAKAKFDEVKRQLQQLLLDHRQAISEVHAKKAQVQKKEADIEQHRQRQAEAENGLFAEKVRELEEAKVEFEAAKEARTNHDSHLPQLRDQFKEAEENEAAASQNVAKARADEQRIRGNIAKLRGGQRNWIDAYPQPRKLHDLLGVISRGTFIEKPVGPLGKHINLVSSKWGNILEKQFGQSLNGFVVANKQDQSTLSGMMDRIGWHAPIFIGNRQYIDTTRNQPDDPNLLTWLKALKIEDNLVRNQLIINQAIEQVALIEDMEEGYEFMDRRGPSTKNVRMCFTFAAGDRRKGRVINYTNNGGINNSPIPEFQGSLRMQLDQQDQIREEQVRLEAVQQELHELERAASEMQAQVNSCKGRERDHERQKKALKYASQQSSDKVDRLEDELSKATPDAAAIEVLEEELEQAKDELKRVGDVYVDVETRKAELNEENKSNKQEMDRTSTAVKELTQRLGKAQVTVQKMQDTREIQLKKKNNAIAKVATATEFRQPWADEVDKVRKELVDGIAEAETFCPERVPIPDGKTVESLTASLHTLEATRKQSEKELGGSQVELLAQANEAKRLHQDAMQEFEDIRSLRNQLITTLANRRNRWKQFRSGISIRARVMFNYLLSERKFRGTLNIDHNKNLLDIHVQPDIMEKSGDGRQTKTLSGGEKSYSTVCLLLSLWDAMGSPIRCLDEFDVFMDSVNRERSMNMIIQAARRSIGRQFIFITPQSMNNVVQTASVKIIKMTDPERGQTALNL